MREMRVMLFVGSVVFWGFIIVELKMRVVAGRVVLTVGAGRQDVGTEWLDKSEHAELRKSGL